MIDDKMAKMAVNTLIAYCDGKRDVVYRDTDGPHLIWARPLRMFMSEVDHEKYPDVTWKWRFQKVADADE